MCILALGYGGFSSQLFGSIVSRPVAKQSIMAE